MQNDNYIDTGISKLVQVLHDLKTSLKTREGGEEWRGEKSRLVTSHHLVLMAALVAFSMEQRLVLRCFAITIVPFRPCLFSNESERTRRKRRRGRRWWKMAFRKESVRPFRRNIGGVLAPGMQIIARRGVYRVAKASWNVNRADSRVAETEASPPTYWPLLCTSTFSHVCGRICACEDRQGERLASPFRPPLLLPGIRRTILMRRVSPESTESRLPFDFH